MKLKYTLFSIIFTILCSANIYAKSQPSAAPKISFKDAFYEFIDTIYDPEYASILSFDDRLILGTSRVLIDVNIKYAMANRQIQISEYQLRQIKSEQTNAILSILSQLPTNEYLIEKLGLLLPSAASFLLFVLGILDSVGVLGRKTQDRIYFKLFMITFSILAVELIAKLYRLRQRALLVETQLRQQYRNQAAQQRRMF